MQEGAAPSRRLPEPLKQKKKKGQVANKQRKNILKMDVEPSGGEGMDVCVCALSQRERGGKISNFRKVLLRRELDQSSCCCISPF